MNSTFNDTHGNSTLNSTQVNSTLNNVPAPGILYAEEPIESKYFRFTLYFIIFVLAVGGNIAVVLVPIRQKRMRNFTYFLITNLAVSDIGSMLCLPPLLYYELTDQWTMGVTMCKLVNPALTMFSLITTNSLVAIAIDRFMALVFPFKRRPNVKESALVISLTWLVAFGLVLPSFGARRVNSILHDGVTYHECREFFPPIVELVYNVSLFLINCTIPILIISAVYAVIIVKLRGVSFTKMFKRKTSKDSDTNNFAKPNGLTSDEYYKKQKNDREKKFTKMLLSVVVVFVLFYVPVQTFFLVLMISPNKVYWEYTQILYRYLFLMMWVPNSLNPILYGSMNEQYAKAFKRIFCCKSPGRDIGSSTTKGSYTRAPNTMHSRNDDGNYTMNTGTTQSEM